MELMRFQAPIYVASDLPPANDPTFKQPDPRRGAVRVTRGRQGARAARAARQVPLHS